MKPDAAQETQNTNTPQASLNRVDSVKTPETVGNGNEVETVDIQLAAVLQESGHDKETLCASLGSVLNGVLSDNVPTRAREAIANALALVLLGKTWSASLSEAGIVWASVNAYSGRFPAYRLLLEAVQRIGRASMLHKLEGAAVSRAVDGWDEPVFGKDGQVGTIRRYSDRLLETLLKAHDPHRYNPQPTGSTSGGQGSAGPIAIQINIVQPHTADKTPTITVDSPET